MIGSSLVLAFSMKINGYFVIFLYILTLKQKSILRRLIQAANWGILGNKIHKNYISDEPIK